MSKAKKIISLVERLFDKEVAEKVTKAKGDMVNSSRVSEALDEQLEINPGFLDDLDVDDYEAIVDELPPKKRASLMGESPDMYETAEMMGDFSPAQAAKDFELFGDLEELQVYASQLEADDAMEFIDNVSDDNYNLLGGMGGLFDIDKLADKLSPKVAGQKIHMFLDDEEKLKAYASKLDAKGTRDFVDNLPDDVYEEYDGLSEYVNQLGPRAQKSKGGEMAGLLIPLEGMPEDTYDNATDEEIEKNASSDKEMEEDYVEHILDKVLSEEDLDFVEKELESNERLATLLSTIILHSSEFSGEGKVEGPGNGLSDSIPARLSDGEFVFTKKAVDELGVDKLQEMMDEAEKTFDERQGKAEGGMLTQKPEAVNDEQTQAVYNSMLSANQMPSLR